MGIWRSLESLEASQGPLHPPTWQFPRGSQHFKFRLTTHLHHRQSRTIDRPPLAVSEPEQRTVHSHRQPAADHTCTPSLLHQWLLLNPSAGALRSLPTDGTPDREEATLLFAVLPRVKVCFTVFPRLLCLAASTLLCSCGMRPQAMPGAPVISDGPAAACLQLQEALTMLTGRGNCLPLSKCSRAHLCHAGAKEA